MAKFPGMTVKGKFCATAREAAARAGCSTQAIYARTGQPTGRPKKYRDIEFRNKTFADVPTAARSEKVSASAVYDHLKRTGQTHD